MAFLTKSAFATLAGVSSNSITKAITKGNKPLAPAVFKKKINPEHPAAVSYIKKQSEGKSENQDTTEAEKQSEEKEDPQQEPEKPKEKKKPVKQKSEERTKKVYRPGETNNQTIEDFLSDVDRDGNLEIFMDCVQRRYIHHLPEDIREVSHLPLNEIIKLFGTVGGFKDWLEATKKIEDISTVRIKNAKSLGELVDKNLVINGIFAPIDALCISLLTDAVKKVVKDMRVFYDLDKSKEECEIEMKKVIGKFIRAFKSQIERGVKGLDV